MRELLLAAAFVAASLTGRASASSPPERQPFERFMGVKDGAFTDGFTFVGANLDPWRFITEAGEVYSLDDFREWVRAAVSATGARVVRMHVNGGAFEPSVGTYGEDAFRQLDRLVAACLENRVYLLVALRDYAWSPWPKTAYDPYWFMGGGTRDRPNKEAILTDRKARNAFKAFVRVVLNRKNTVTGAVYKDDPTILGWELLNEPPFYPGQTRRWIEEMSDVVKGIDPNHLVGIAIGATEEKWWAPASTNWAELATRKLDFVDLHYYADAALYHPSVDPGNVAALRERVVRARALGKPVILGEFGLPNDRPPAQIQALYETVIDTALAAGAAGILPYSWGPPGPNRLCDKGSYCLYTDRPELCGLLKSRAR